jgi:hypothetical protein
MTAVILDPIANPAPTKIFYPCSDGKPLARSKGQELAAQIALYQSR